MSVPKEHRYEADIVGHAPPFKWSLQRIEYGKTRVSAGKSGSADTYELALADAEIAAELAHHEWVHRSTTETVIVLVVPVEEPPKDDGPSAAELERMFQMRCADDPVIKPKPDAMYERQDPKRPDIDPADFAD